MQRRYALLDVFTDRPLAGNQLAVVLDGEGLDDARMQAIAAEFKLSETVFVLPAANPLHSASVRIFTPARELPFAGHPTVGTAVLLGLEAAARNGSVREQMLVLEEKVGPVRCGVSVKGDGAGHAVFDLPRLPSETGRAPDREVIAAAIGLTPSEVGFENHHPSLYSAGNEFLFVPVRDLSVVAQIRVQPDPWASLFKSTNAIGTFVYCRETTATGRHFHSRMLAPGAGVDEDPATGSAVAAFAGVVRRFDGPPAGEHRYVIEQGFEMGRPSLIRLEVDLDGGEIKAARIAGDAVVFARGTLSI